MIFFNSIFADPPILIGFVLGIIVAITVHEFFHAWSANYFGDPTAKNMGRLTLNPFAHFDITGTIFLLLAGFGWGKPVPINPNNFRNPKWDQLWVALAGPISNLITALLLSIPYRILYFQPESLYAFNNSEIGIVINIVAEINVILALFNLLPIPPLDGSEIVAILLSEKNQALFFRIGPIILFTILALEFMSININFFSSVFTPLIRATLYLVRVFPFG